MKNTFLTGGAVLVASGIAMAAVAQTPNSMNNQNSMGNQSPVASQNPMTAIPSGSQTVTDWYKQDVYDPSNNKIGSISDVLVTQDGNVAAIIVGVGGFLGVDQKDIAVAFGAIRETTQNNKIRLTMNATKDGLKAAPGFKYDSNSTSWVPDTSKNR
jgi:hypothetical protein